MTTSVPTAPAVDPPPPPPRHLTAVPDLDPVSPVAHGPEEGGDVHDDDGSLLAEYGLIAVVAAAIAGVLITWASNGAIADLFDALLSSARGLAGS